MGTYTTFEISLHHHPPPTPTRKLFRSLYSTFTSPLCLAYLSLPCPLTFQSTFFTTIHTITDNITHTQAPSENLKSSKQQNPLLLPSSLPAWRAGTVCASCLVLVSGCYFLKFSEGACVEDCVRSIISLFLFRNLISFCLGPIWS